MAAIMLQTIPSFHAIKSEKCLFIVTKTYEKKTLFVKTTASPIPTTRRVFLPVCKFLIIVFWEIGERLQKFDTFCIT